MSENLSTHRPTNDLWFDTDAISSEELENFLQAVSASGIRPVSINRTIPEGTGLFLFKSVTEELCEALRNHSRYCSRILAVTLETKALDGAECWQLLSNGASDVIAWSDDVGLKTIQARIERWRVIDRIVSSEAVSNYAIGKSNAWQSILRDVVELAYFTDSSALIMGETGTGKELISNLIHSLDRRPAKGNRVIVDCTTIAPELSGSEFFGHERGAFTNAVTSRDGAFALADGGSLFLDEVGELPLRLQKELLRVVQEHTFKKVGSNTWHSTSFRLICATNRELTRAVGRNSFRRDLYHRIATWIIRLPALRDRKEDILPLARHFLGEIFPQDEVPELDPAVRDCLLAKDYPGNVRDLRNLILRIGHRHVGSGPITVGDIPTSDRPEWGQFIKGWRDDNFVDSIRRALAGGANLETLKSATAETAYEIALKEEAGDAKRAATRLGVSVRAVQAKRAVQKREAAD